LFRWFFKRKKKAKFDAKLFHDSIRTLPQHNWEQMNVTNDPLWLLMDQENRTRKITEEETEAAYFTIYDQYAEATGLHERMEPWRDLMIMRMEARVQVAEGDASAQNMIDIYTYRIKELMKSGGDTNVIKNRMLVQKVYGQPIKPLEISVYEYLMICQIVQEMNTATTPTEDVDSD
jgi:hypothetical protein